MIHQAGPQYIVKMKILGLATSVYFRVTNLIVFNGELAVSGAAEERILRSSSIMRHEPVNWSQVTFETGVGNIFERGASLDERKGQ